MACFTLSSKWADLLKSCLTHLLSSDEWSEFIVSKINKRILGVHMLHSFKCKLLLLLLLLLLFLKLANSLFQFHPFYKALLYRTICIKPSNKAVILYRNHYSIVINLVNMLSHFTHVYLFSVLCKLYTKRWTCMSLPSFIYFRRFYC